MYQWRLPPCSQRVSADAAHSGRTGRRDERSAQSAAMAWHTGTYLARRRNGVDSCGSGRVIHLIDAARLHGPDCGAAGRRHGQSRKSRLSLWSPGVEAISNKILNLCSNSYIHPIFCSKHRYLFSKRDGVVARERVRVRTGAVCGRDGGAIRSFASSWPPGRRREHGQRNGHCHRGW
jgi:hypothetical protein